MVKTIRAKIFPVPERHKGNPLLEAGWQFYANSTGLNPGDKIPDPRDEFVKLKVCDEAPPHYDRFGKTIFLCKEEHYGEACPYGRGCETDPFSWRNEKSVEAILAEAGLLDPQAVKGG